MHVEASLLGSIILAGVILKLGILFCSLFVGNRGFFIVGVVIACGIMGGADRKVVIAYSSVAHMTMCAMMLRFMSFVMGLTHVFISPLMFLMVYVRYVQSGSRVLGRSLLSYLLGTVILLNIGFPMVGAFISEIYIV